MAELERLKQIKCFLFDMDGTINLGNTLIPGMDAFFKKLRSYGRDFTWLPTILPKGTAIMWKKCAAWALR